MGWTSVNSRQRRPLNARCAAIANEASGMKLFNTHGGNCVRRHVTVMPQCGHNSQASRFANFPALTEAQYRERQP